MSGGRMPRRHTVHRAVLELGETLLAERELPNLLEPAVDMVHRIIKADVVAILEIAQDRTSMRGLTAAGIDAAASMRRIVDEPDPALWEAVRSGRVVVTRGNLSAITAPINAPPPLAREGRVGAFGVLTARSWKSRTFTATHIQVVADTAALLSRTLARRASELKLRDSEERYRLLADRSPDPLFRTRLYPEPRLEYISPSVEALSGYTAEELLDGDRNAAWNVIHPEDRGKAAAVLKDPRNLTYPLSLRWIHKSGAVVFTEQRVTPVLDAQGNWLAYQGVIRDVTDRVLAEQRRQAEAEVTQLILEGHQAREVFEAAAGHLSRLSRADFALLALPASNRAGWAVRVISGDPAQKPQEIVLLHSDPVISRVMAASATVIIDNLSTALPPDHPFGRLGWMGSAVLEPIRGYDGVLGILGIVNVPAGRRFSDIGLRAVGDFAQQAALAIEYERARDDLKRLAVLEDRARISRELHDGVIQSLFGAGMLLEGISGNQEVSPTTRDGIERVATMIDNTMVDVRSYIFDLRPSVLTGRNLDQGLRLLAEDFEKATSIPCSVETDAGALAGLERAAPQLIQIGREALSNVARHSRATHCWVALHRRAGVIFEIRDDGLGFRPGPATTGNGLKNIRGRAAQIGARVKFVSEPGSGSIVRVHIPRPSSVTTTSAAQGA